MPLYKDMSARDLLQRRTTDLAGNTQWDNSSLVTCALEGGLAVLDGIEQLPYGTLGTLTRLLNDREANLPDGSRLVPTWRYDAMVKE